MKKKRIFKIVLLVILAVSTTSCGSELAMILGSTLGVMSQAMQDENNGTTQTSTFNPVYTTLPSISYVPMTSSYNSSSSSDSYSSSSSSKHPCSLCHGKGRIVRNSSVSTYGMDHKVYCQECGQSFMASTGHGHVTCTLCHGKRYLD